jgi:O-antigen ligase
LGQWQLHPILGYGLGISTYVSTNKLYPHNDYVRALVEGGIVGLLTFLIFFIVQIVRLIRIYRDHSATREQRDLCLVMLAIILAIPVGMITENIWSHTTLFFYWWTLFGVVGWNWNERQTKENVVLPEPRFPSSKAFQNLPHEP